MSLARWGVSSGAAELLEVRAGHPLSARILFPFARRQDGSCLSLPGLPLRHKGQGLHVRQEDALPLCGMTAEVGGRPSPMPDERIGPAKEETGAASLFPSLAALLVFVMVRIRTGRRSEGGTPDGREASSPVQKH